MGSMPGMGGAGEAPPDLLPTWLGVVGAALFLVIVVSHLRHAIDSSGTRRWWHGGHVLMAVMYLPIFRIGISSSVWQVIFGLSIAVLCGAALLTVNRAPSALWLLMALDMAAMVYMWNPSYRAALSWIAAGYLVLESTLWASDRIRAVDRPLTGGSYSLGEGGVICVAAGETLATERDLRISMCAMTAGMAYMIVAMQLMS